MLLLIGAMHEELQKILDYYHAQKITAAPFEIYQPQNPQFLCCVSGIGLVNAAGALAYCLSRYPEITKILVVGTAGSVQPFLKQGDLVLVNNALYGSADVRAFGYKLGQIPQMPDHFSATPKVLELVEKNAPFKFSYFKVNCASMDVFIDNNSQVKNLIVPLPLDIAIVDMEVASYYQIAWQFNKPILAVKIISDSLTAQNQSSVEFKDFLPKASEKILQIICYFLEWI